MQVRELDAPTVTSTLQLTSARERHSPADVSQHLARLRWARLVRTRKRGIQVFYRIENPRQPVGRVAEYRIRNGQWTGSAALVADGFASLAGALSAVGAWPPFRWPPQSSVG